jgi:HAD superfamily hydrolase (TIGR01509 family)
MFEAAICDMDGTLLDTEHIGMRAWLSANDTLGLHVAPDYFLRLVGRPATDIAPILLEAVDDLARVSALIRLATLQYETELQTAHIPLKRGAVELLALLGSLNVRVGIATSTPTKVATYRLRKAGILGRVSVVVGGDAVTAGKPSPDIYLKTSALLNSQPTRSLVIEDSPLGVLGAARAGMRVLMVPDLVQPTIEARRTATAVLPDLFSVMHWMHADLRM